MQPAQPNGRDRDTVRRRLRRLVGTLLLIIALVGAGGLAATVYATHTVSRLAGSYGPASDDTADALAYMLTLQSSAAAYLLDGDPAFLTSYSGDGAVVLQRIDSTKARLDAIGDHSLDAAIEREGMLARRWLDDYAAPIGAGRGASAGPANTDLGQGVFAQFRGANSVVLDSLRASRADLRAGTLRLRDTALYAIAAASLLAVAVATLFGLRMTRALTTPLDALSRTVRRIGGGELSARADAERGPAEVRAVAGAVNALGADVERAAVAQEAAERLRERAQPLSESLRIGVDPMTMCQGLVVALGALLGVDRVWLCTFDDERAPGLTVQWHGQHVRALPDRIVSDAAALRTIANRLWNGAGLSAVDDLADYETASEVAPLFAAARDHGSTAAVLAAVGDGASAMGVLGMSHCSAPHHWTSTELTVVNRICAELAHSLVQGNMLSRQQEVIRQLRELDEAKSKLVSTVSHELRTPLTSITGYLEMALDGDGGPLPSGAESMLRVAERNVTRLRALIEDLLTQSRIEAGRLRVSISRVDLHEVVTDVVASMAPIAEANEVSLGCDVPAAGQLCVDGDLRQLEQAVTNLVANAIKFTPAGGRVKVEAYGRDSVGVGGGDAVLVRVRDTGIGVPEPELPQLFESFFRASNATGAEIPGTGLGLSIVREIVHAHGGELGVESTLGAGTTMTITLARSPG